jgi:CRISPR-associated protein Cmr4
MRRRDRENKIEADDQKQEYQVFGHPAKGKKAKNNQGESSEQVNNKESSNEDGGTTEAYVKFEYASLVWLPVFCPGQPIVYVSCPRLLQRYGAIKKITDQPPEPYHASPKLKGRATNTNQKVLFFNLGWMEVQTTPKEFNWSPWLDGTGVRENQVVVVDDADIAMIHDMALYRQSRVALEDTQKKVKGGAFFDVEALPEGSVLIFPVAIKVGLETPWQPLPDGEKDIYLGGLESIGFGRCEVSFSGDYFVKKESEA